MGLSNLFGCCVSAPCASRAVVAEPAVPEVVYECGDVPLVKDAIYSADPCNEEAVCSSTASSTQADLDDDGVDLDDFGFSSSTSSIETPCASAAEGAPGPPAGCFLAAPAPAPADGGVAPLSRSASEGAAEVLELMRLTEPGQVLGAFSDFAKEYVDEDACRKLLKKHRGDRAKCADALRKLLSWRESNRELLTTRRFQLAIDNRVLGADSAGRPVLYLCMKNQLLPASYCVDQYIVCTLQAIDNMPPGVDRATHIWDAHGMMLRLNWNLAPVISMMQAMEGYFADRLHKFIIAELPRPFLCLKDAIWPYLSASTRKKVLFMSQEQVAEHVRRECDAQTSERIVSVMCQNRDLSLSLEDRRRTWMRVDPRGEVVPAFA